MGWFQRFLITTAALTAAALGCNLAMADDFLPPEFRGDELTVMAEWDFVTDFTVDPYNHYNYPPDQLVTVGDGGAHTLGNAFTHAHFTDTVFWRPGEAFTLEEPGQIDFYLVNWIDEYPYKHLWIQITYGGQGTPWVNSVVGPDPMDGSWTNPSYGQLADILPTEPGRRVEYWVLQPNPDREHIYLDIPPYTDVQQILVDTISTPSPVASEPITLDSIKALFR